MADLNRNRTAAGAAGTAGTTAGTNAANAAQANHGAFASGLATAANLFGDSPSGDLRGDRVDPNGSPHVVIVVD